MLGVDLSQLEISREDFKGKLVEHFGLTLPDWADDWGDVPINEITEDFGESEEFDCADENRYFGIRLAQASDEGIGTFVLSLTDVERMEQKLRDLLAELGEVAEVKLVG